MVYDPYSLLYDVGIIQLWIAHFAVHYAALLHHHISRQPVLLDYTHIGDQQDAVVDTTDSSFCFTYHSRINPGI